MSKDAAPAKDAGDGAASKPKKPLALIAIMLVAGLALGGGGATAYFTMMQPKDDAAHPEPAKEEEAEAAPVEPDEYVELARFYAPMVTTEGTLLGYSTMKLTFEVAAADATIVKDQMPLIQHQMNVVLASTRIGLEQTPRMVDIPKAAKLFLQAANEAIEKPVVKAVQIVSATSA